MAQMAGMCKWKTVTANPDTQLIRADAVKAFLLKYVGTHKRAFAMLNHDFGSELPSINRQFCSAVLFDGFEVSTWTRCNVGSTTSFQSNSNTSGFDYWTSTYDLQLSPTDTVTILIDIDS